MQPLGRTGAGDNWETPIDVFDAIDRAYGPFDLDAAATDQNALCPAWYTIEDDGLSRPWKGTVWVNPPYSRIAPWTAKAAAEVRAGNADAVVMLLPARTGCRWWRQALADGSVPVYLPGRLHFSNGGRAAFESALLIFGRAGRHREAHKCGICSRLFFARRGAKTCSAQCRMASHPDRRH